MTGVSLFPKSDALAKALERVRQRHPFRADGPPDLAHPRVVEEIRRLEALLMALPPDQLPTAVAALSPRQVRLLAESIPGPVGEAPPAPLLRALYQLRDDPFLGERGLDLYVGTNGDTAFQRAASSCVARYANPPVLWRRLVEEAAPLAVLMTVWKESRSELEAWLQLPTVGLLPRTRLVPQLRGFLADRAPDELWMEHRQGAAEVLALGMTTVPADSRDAWFARYLNGMAGQKVRGYGHPIQDWPLDHAILRHIESAYRLPSDGTVFWAMVTEKAAGRFRLWHVERELTYHLGEGERTRFWCNYLNEIAFSEQNADKKVVLIYLKGWTAVVFKDAGTATHLLALQDSYGLRNRNASQLRAFLYGRVPVLGKYEHRGYTVTWQDHAAEEIARVKRELSADAERSGA